MKKSLVGKKFGMLTVLERLDGRKILCKCDCGNVTTPYVSNVTRSHTTSCGCHRKKRIIESITKHGKSRTKAYSVWNNMRSRCKNKNVRCYKNYGGRGITVCDSWEKFENFLRDMGEPEPWQSLERIDNEKGYSPDNCVWADATTQANNTRKNVYLEVDGVSKTIAQWAKEYGLPYNRIALRIKAGWSHEDAVKTPLRPMKRKAEWRTAQPI